MADEPGSAPASQRRHGSSDRNLPVAIASGVVLAGLFAGALAVSPYAFLLFVFVIVVVALVELDAAFRGRGLRPATLVVGVAGAVMLFGAYREGASAQALGLVLLLFGALAWTLLDRDRRRLGASLGATFLMALWVPFAASFLGLLLARDDGTLLVVATIALTVVADVAGFGWGVAFGRHRMAPSVSPGKTWEGFAGALLTVLAVAAGVALLVEDVADVRTAVVFGAGVTIAAVLGDLAESLVKRDLGVKDLGRILPGHGGIMDRVDGIVFALPAAHLLLLALGR